MKNEYEDKYGMKACMHSVIFSGEDPIRLLGEIESKKAGTQERRDEFQERGVYFEVGYADADLDDIEKMSLEQLEQLAGKCEKVIVTFTYSGYFNKYVKYPSWKWVLQ